MRYAAALKEIANWVLPPRIQEEVGNRLLWRATLRAEVRKHLAKNRRFRGIHAGKRCFILCNGPSVNAENLAPLAREICFSVSNFYKHPLYEQVRPRYHCVPSVLPPHTDEEITAWFQEMHQATLEATVFLSSRQAPLIRRQHLFPARDVTFVHMGAGFIPNPRNIDISRGVVRVQSVPIMCLVIALYMGFGEIYLLGTDHCSLWTGEYNYSFERKDLVLKDPYTDGNGRNNYSLTLEFQTHLRLWEQYQALHEIAAGRGVRIVNLAQESRLDVFPRGSLAEVLVGS